MEILIISGMSGSGKSQTAKFLEDIGYYIVDNLPAEMMVKFANFCTASGGHYDRVALVYDIRAGEPFEALVNAIDEIRATGVLCRLLFLDASTNSIINRYKETRRSHPLSDSSHNTEKAVTEERIRLTPVKDHADFILDTSAFSSAKLRSEIITLFGSAEDLQGININVMSFGFKHGIPIEADLVFDVRFMPNPYYDPNLKEKTGLDKEVKDFVFGFEQTNTFIEKLEDMLTFLLPLYNEEGKTVLVIAIGCTGGHHRSVAVAHEVSECIRKLGYKVTENHRDISR